VGNSPALSLVTTCWHSVYDNVDNYFVEEVLASSLVVTVTHPPESAVPTINQPIVPLPTPIAGAGPPHPTLINSNILPYRC
jgi:hypothetical protein